MKQNYHLLLQEFPLHRHRLHLEPSKEVLADHAIHIHTHGFGIHFLHKTNNLVLLLYLQFNQDVLLVKTLGSTQHEKHKMNVLNMETEIPP